MKRLNAETLIRRFSSLKILVLGDFMLDHYLRGRVDRISPEAPVPIVDVQSETYSLGGAGNVVSNLHSLGASILPIGIIGQDDAGTRLWAELKRCCGDCGQMLRSNERRTTLKTRIVAHHQQVVRADREERTLITPAMENEIAERFISCLPEVDGIVISDYAKGSMTPGLLARILPAAQATRKPVCLDPKPRFFSYCSPVTVITPNLAEAGAVVGHAISTEEDLLAAGEEICRRIRCEALLITRGENGMALFSGGTMTLIPARAREVYDVTGAGDTVISVLCLALAAGAEILEAVKLTNMAAAIAVGKLGTASVSPAELLAAAEQGEENIRETKRNK